MGTDLLFLQVSDALKVINNAPCRTQTFEILPAGASYATGADKAIGIFCAFDDFPNKVAPTTMVEAIRSLRFWDQQRVLFKG